MVAAGPPSCLPRPSFAGAQVLFFCGLEAVAHDAVESFAAGGCWLAATVLFRGLKAVARVAVVESPEFRLLVDGNLQ